MSIAGDFEFFLQWHLTDHCNLRCSHCYQSGSSGPELSLKEIRSVAAEAAAMLQDWERLYDVSIARSCNLTGGEPLLRRDLLAVIEELGAAGFSLYLLTNGTLIDCRQAQEWAARGVKGVQVSIEGPEEVHDGIRGAGSYRDALRGTKHLLEAGLPVTFNLTLSRLNAPHLEGLLATAADLGVPRVGFSRLVPAGAGTALREEMLDPHEVEELYRRIFSLNPAGVRLVSGDPIAWQMGMEPGAGSGCTPLGGCAAGVSGLTLLPDGTILPCRRLHIPLGNVRKDALREIWATSPVLQRLRQRDLYSGKCGRCERWSGCRGCRAIAFACGDYLGEDPQCFID